MAKRILKTIIIIIKIAIMIYKINGLFGGSVCPMIGSSIIYMKNKYQKNLNK